MSRQKSRLNAQILEEAAEWFVEFDDGEAEIARRQAFDAWLRQSPEHVRAFLELLPIWERGAAVHSSPDMDPESLIAQALSARANIIPLNASLSGPSDPSKPQASAIDTHEAKPNHEAKATHEAKPFSVRPVKPRRARPAMLALAASVVLAVLGLWFYSQPDAYSTGIGEQRSITLADGSIVQLNALSRLRIRFTEHGRDVELLDGQALFRVAHEKARPFVVHSGETKIRAVGTQFDVYRKKTGITVTVLEGRVEVLEPPRPVPRGREAILPPEREVFLSAGEQVSVTPTVISHPTRADVTSATAWTQRRLMFQKTTLAEVVDEFNRYNPRPLRLEDSHIGAFLISGTFSSTDPTSLLRFLREQPGIHVLETDSVVHISSAP